LKLNATNQASFFVFYSFNGNKLHTGKSEVYPLKLSDFVEGQKKITKPIVKKGVADDKVNSKHANDVGMPMAHKKQVRYITSPNQPQASNTGTVMIITFAIMACVAFAIYFILRKKCRTVKKAVREVEKSPSPAKGNKDDSSSAIKPPSAIRRSGKKEAKAAADLESSTRQQLNNPDHTGLDDVELGEFESGNFASNQPMGGKKAIRLESIKFAMKDNVDESIEDGVA